MTRFSLPALLAGCCALVAFAMLARDIAAAPDAAAPPENATAAPPPPAAASAPAPVDLAVYAAIAARPLFFPTRRPPPAPAGAAAPATPPLDFTLVGVVTGPSQNPSQTMALVQQPGQAAAVLVHVGSVVDGWTVTRIDRSGIEVQANGTSSALRIVQ